MGGNRFRPYNEKTCNKHVGADSIPAQKGITLIALIITIILMLILAGVVLNVTIGENGLFKISKKAGEDYKIASIKERIEEEIIALQAGKIVNDEKLTVEQAIIGIQEKEVFSEIDLAEEIGIVEGYVIKLGYDTWDNVIIEGIEKDGKTRITTSIEPKGYTNGNVTIEIIVKSDNIKVTNIEVPEGMTKKEDGIYEVTKNGTYLVKATLSNGKVLEKEIKISTIDKLPPKEFTITAKQEGNNIVVVANTQDNEQTTDNACSGIDRYEYLVKKNGDEKYTLYKTNKIYDLDIGSYIIYAIAYDEANNLKETEPIKINKIKESAVTYGQRVNYEANGITDWKIFYKNDETNETFIIASDYLPNEKIPSEAGMSIIETLPNQSNWKTVPEYTEITQTVRDRYMMSWDKSTTYDNIKCVSKLLDTSIWSNFVRNDLVAKGVTAVGSPTLEMFCASWNDLYPDECIKCYSYNTGLVPVYGDVNLNNSAEYRELEAWNNKMLFPRVEIVDNEYVGYFLASPSYLYKNPGYGASVAIVLNSRYFGSGVCTDSWALRPVVCLTSAVELTYNNNTKMWDIN